MTTMDVVACPACGAKNRISQEKVEHGMAPVCGRCKKPLPSQGGVMEVTDTLFPAEVERAALPVLVDFWAPWCPPCRMIAPVVEKLAQEMAGRVRVMKMNIDENQETPARFRVESIPTLLVFKGGREVDRMVGAMPAAEIRKRLERAGS